MQCHCNRYAQNIVQNIATKLFSSKHDKSRYLRVFRIINNTGFFPTTTIVNVISNLLECIANILPALLSNNNCVINTGIMNNSVFLAMDYMDIRFYLSFMPSNISSPLYTECMLANVIQFVHAQMYFLIYSMAVPGCSQTNVYKTCYIY